MDVEQEAGGGGMLGTNPEAERFGAKTFMTGHQGAGGERQEAAAAAPAGAGETGATGGATATTTMGSSSKMSLAPFDDAPQGVKRVIGSLGGMIAARGMADHCAVMGPTFARDVVVDTPFAILHRLGDLRCACYALFGSLTTSARFEPAYCEWGPAGPSANALEVVGTMIFHPRKTILFPPSLVVPSEIRFRATVMAGVAGDWETGKIEYARFRPENLPIVPGFLRSLIGGNAARLLHTTEPYWGWLAGLVGGDEFYSERRGGGGGHGSGAGGFVGTGGGYVGTGAGHRHHYPGGSFTDSAIDYGSSLVSRAAAYAGALTATARRAAEAVLPDALVPGGGGHPTHVGAGGIGAGGGGGHGYGAPTTTTTLSDVAPRGGGLDVGARKQAGLGGGGGLGSGSGAGGKSYATAVSPTAAARQRQGAAAEAAY
jgi:hypothetical protein